MRLEVVCRGGVMGIAVRGAVSLAELPAELRPVVAAALERGVGGPGGA